MEKTPRAACIQINSICNLRCGFCDFWKDPKEMNFATLKNIIDQLSALNVDYIGITGGEPTLHKNIWDLIDYCKAKSMKVSLNSNGTTMTKELVCKLNDSKLNVLQISLDGLSTTHDKLRGIEGCYSKVIKGLELLEDCKIHKEIVTVITPENIKELLELEKLAIKYGCSFALTLVYPYENNNKTESFDRDIKLLKEIKDKFQLKNSKVSTEKIIKALEEGNSHCSLPHSRFTIRYDLTLAPCAFIKGQDISNRSIIDTYDQKDSKKLRDECHRREIPECKDCFIWATR